MKLDTNNNGIHARAVEEQTRQALDESLDNIDAATLSRLNQARQQALAYHDETSFFQRVFSFNRHWLQQTVFASIAIVAISVITLQIMSHEPALNLEQGEYIADAEELELVEDLEFIAWLLEQEQLNNDHAG